MALHPVGPLPASVYWRRRLVLLAVLVAVVLLARSCTGGEVAPTGATTTPTPTPTASQRVVTPSPTASRSAGAAAGSCRDEDLRLALRSDATTYQVGTRPRFTLTVTNASAVPCRRDLGGRQVELLVYSGQDRIWSSDDCGDTTGTAVQTLGAGKSLETTMTWPGTRSRRGCDGDKPQARPGTYYVKARLGTLRGSGAVFRLRE